MDYLHCSPFARPVGVLKQIDELFITHGAVSALLLILVELAVRDVRVPDVHRPRQACYHHPYYVPVEPKEVAAWPVPRRLRNNVIAMLGRVL